MDINAIWNTLDMISDTLGYALIDMMEHEDLENPSKTYRRVKQASDMLLQLMGELEGEVESTYEGIPSVSVNYADGSSMRITGHFDQSTVEDVSRLIRYRSAEEINDD